MKLDLLCSKPHQSIKKNWKFIDDLIAIVFINYFTLFNYQRQELGIALDPDFALINHSCIPNCCQITNDCNEFQIVSTLPINNGEELTSHMSHWECHEKLDSLNYFPNFLPMSV